MDRPIEPFAPGKIFPPLPRDTNPPEIPAADRNTLDVNDGLVVFLTAVAATLIGSFATGALTSVIAQAVGARPIVAWQYGSAIGFLGGTVYGMVWTVRSLNRRARGALMSRGPRGCAWQGARDAVVAQAFLFGGLLNVMALVTLPPGSLEYTVRESALLPLAQWQGLPAMVLAFAIIAARPVLEELVFRGVLFAALSERLGWTLAGMLVTLLFVVGHRAQLELQPTALIWIGAMGVTAMLLRIRHASLAPAIALHVGFNFPAVLFATLV